MENLLCELDADICLDLAVSKTIVPIKRIQTLSACINDIVNANLATNTSEKFNNDCVNDLLLNQKTLKIAQQLAIAIDKNSVDGVKKVKLEYGETEEFIQAKKILNQKCKQIWNPYEVKDKPFKIPVQAMKTLGISNQPLLDSLLGHSVRYFENDNGNTTSFIITSILNNKNMNYSIDDIHEYLKQMNKKEKCFCNLNTVKYLITTHKYTKQKLLDLGIDEISIQKAVKSLDIKNKIRYYSSLIKNN